MSRGDIKRTMASALTPHSKRFAGFFGDPALPTATYGYVGDPEKAGTREMDREWTENGSVTLAFGK